MRKSHQIPKESQRIRKNATEHRRIRENTKESKRIRRIISDPFRILPYSLRSFQILSGPLERILFRILLDLEFFRIFLNSLRILSDCGGISDPPVFLVDFLVFSCYIPFFSNSLRIRKNSRQSVRNQLTKKKSKIALLR